MPPSGFSRFRNPLVIILAMVSGIVCGRFLHAMPDRTPGEKPHETARSHPASEQRVSPDFKARQRPPESKAIVPPDPEECFVVPPAALQRIRVNLMTGTSLDLKECELLGLEEKQIQELKLMVDSTVLRWQEREKATMEILPSSGPHTLLHIPHADPATAEKEWQDLKAGVLRIAGPELGPLLHFRLTDGNSPSRQSNFGTGLLNVLTAGYGSLDRLVKITPGDNYTNYEIVDFQSTRQQDAAVDEALFSRLRSSGSHDGSKDFSDTKIPDQLLHLIPLK